MPRIIDYPDVLERMREQRFVSLYHNSGAFGFPKEIVPHVVGWIGPEDTTLRSDAKGMGVQVQAPYEETLSRLLVRAWSKHLSGPAWVLPMSHWNYELDFGSRDWMPAAIREIGIDPDLLVTRNNGSAIEFLPEESSLLAQLAARLLQNLLASDFAILFPNRPVICTLHHHKQLWWQTSDEALAQALREHEPRP